MSWKKISFGDKKRITIDWQHVFPSLGIYKPMHLLNRIGPLLVGILLEVKSGNESYIPTFHVHCLLQPFPTVSLGLVTTINREYVHLEWHEKKYLDLAERMKKAALIPFEGDLDLGNIIDGFSKYAAKPTFPYQPEVYEDIILICAWCGNEKGVQNGLRLAESHMKQWPENVLGRMGGLKNWQNSVEEKAQNREELHRICEQQIIELKVDKLPSRNLMI